MGAGRFACVAMPLALTAASIICLLIVMLAGIADKNISLFEIRTQNLSISSSSLENLADLVTRDTISTSSLHVARDLDLSGINVADITDNIPSGSDLLNSAGDAATQAIAGGNITASALGLADYYKVALWNYCAWTDGKQNCTGAKFDWASSEFNSTALHTNVTVSGQSQATVQLPKEVRTALKTFSVVLKWTQVVYIIAIIAAAVELIFGLFAICSRIGSCCTYIVASIATTAIFAASILATVQASVVVGAVKASAKAYNVNASINRTFMIVTWLAAAFSVAAGLFWLFTICCCAADHRSSSKKNHGASSRAGNGAFMGFGAKRGSGHTDGEKLLPTGSYQRVGDDHTAYAGQQHGVYNNERGYSVLMQNFKPVASGGNGAYEPYSHTRV